MHNFSLLYTLLSGVRLANLPLSSVSFSLSLSICFIVCCTIPHTFRLVSNGNTPSSALLTSHCVFGRIPLYAYDCCYPNTNTREYIIEDELRFSLDDGHLALL